MAGSYYNAILRINSQAGDYTAAIADFNSDTIIRLKQLE